MVYTNVHYGARFSPSKGRGLTALIRGKSAEESLTILGFSKKRAAVFIKEALKAAIANADQAEVDVRRLVVVDARIDQGPTLKRFRPKDRGRAHAIKKRTSHITVSVADAEETSGRGARG